MRLESVALRNFNRFYGAHCIDLAPGVNFIVSRNLDEPETFESNAVGKTSILLAISYALFGKTFNSLVGHDLISHQCGPKDYMKVILEFSEGVTVERSYYPHRKRSEVSLKHPKEHVTGDPSVVTKKIQEFFHVSPELFKNGLMMSNRDSKAKQFLNAEPAERSKILGELVDDRVWQKAGELLTTDAKEKEAQVLAAANKLQVHQRNLQTLEMRLGDVSASLATAHQQEQQRRGKLKERQLQLRDLIKQETAVEMNPPKITAQQLEKRRVEIAKRLQQEQEALRDVPTIPAPLGLGVTCPTCRSVVQAEVIEQVIAQRTKATTQRDQLKKQIAQTQRELENVQGMQQQSREWQARANLAAERRERYKTELAHVEEELAAKSVSLFALADQERTLKQQVSEQRAEIQTLSTGTVGIKEEAQRMQRLAAGFKYEIRNLLFDRIKGDLEKFTAAYLHNLAGQGIRVDYPSGGDTAREKFEILVYAEEKLQKLEQYSGGEGWRVSLAILFALRDVLVLKSDCSLPLLLIDDPVGPVDPIGLTNLFSTLQGLVDNGSAPTILVTLPSESDATTGNLIRLQRKNGMTEVL